MADDRCAVVPTRSSARSNGACAVALWRPGRRAHQLLRGSLLRVSLLRSPPLAAGTGCWRVSGVIHPELGLCSPSGC